MSRRVTVIRGLPPDDGDDDMSEEKLDRIEATLERLEKGFSSLNDKVGDLDTKVGRLDTDVRVVNERVDAYQKASQQVVNLAFSLIVAATLAILVPVVFSR